MSPAVITAVAAWRPASIPYSQWRRLSERIARSERSGWHAWARAWRAEHERYGHARGTDVHAIVPEHMHGNATRVPVATHDVLSGLAAQVATSLWASRARATLGTPAAQGLAAAKEIGATQGSGAPDIVIFCHTSLDEHVSSTTAGRLRAALGAPCFAFSISQQQGASVFTALRLASDLLTAEPDVSTILIVAAEKWRPPFSRWATPYLLQGDAAGALLIERASETTQGLHVIDACTARTGAREMSQLHRASGVARSWGPPLVSLIAELLARHGRLACEIDDAIGHRGSAWLTRIVHEYLGREDPSAFDEHHVNLGAAESIVRLAERLKGVTLLQQARLLLWGFGLGGYVGAALLEANGTPHVTLQAHT